MSFESNGFDVEVEITAQAANKGNVTEVPISFGERIGQQKLNPFRDGFRIMLTIWKLARKYNMIIFYTSLISLMIFPSTLMLLWVALEWFYGTWHSGIALLGVMLMILTTQAITLNAFVSQLKRMENRLVQKIKTLNN